MLCVVFLDLEGVVVADRFHLKKASLPPSELPWVLPIDSDRGLLPVVRLASVVDLQPLNSTAWHRS